jgi:hypothetical protein
MKSDDLRNRLELARKQIAQDALRIEQQKALIAELESTKNDTLIARQLLEVYEIAQRDHLQDEERIKSELADLDRRRGAKGSGCIRLLEQLAAQLRKEFGRGRLDT